ncbi:hypothetical protein VQ042_25485 [Aurantimonas sp. A2-1-M11]|uniref:hypothetical protein n=1 Tax=Aurantimonas sp. A2-1-M11 TaxID=3113712 RepID=UPI002F935A46
MDHNVWAPGVSGWREVVAEGYPAWVQPSGAHDAYQIGDRVSFEGANYESVINANVWSPAGYPAGGRRSPDDLAAHRGIINALAMRGDRAVLGAAFFMGSQGQIFLLLSAY